MLCHILPDWRLLWPFDFRKSAVGAVAVAAVNDVVVADGAAGVGVGVAAVNDVVVVGGVGDVDMVGNGHE